LLKPINIGICGLGTVGYGSFCVLKENKLEITRRLGQEINVSHVATFKLGPDQEIGETTLSNDAFAVANDPDVDIVLELIGGYDIALKVVLTAIANGKHVVTANKALIAVHGNEIFAAAKEKNVVVAYEAAVAGGIPIIKTMREGLTANHIQWLAGIINGTGNFILTEMKEKGRDFDSVLKEAQDLGYAEADPTFDVEGIDAAHKLTILASTAFGIPLQFEKTYTEGISAITPEDIKYADELGYSIKHLGISRKLKQGIELRVHPTLISKDSLLANVNGVMNAVLVNGDAVGSTLSYGAGAGARPTASAVIADIIDVARRVGSGKAQDSVPVLGFQNESLSDIPVLKISDIVAAYYLRISVSDKAGVMAGITETLAQHGISIEAIIQKELGTSAAKESSVSVVILTDEIKESVMDTAIAEIESLGVVTDKIVRIRVDKLDQ
jgi:homoserine dehydrogenase